jgi:hypothetical protein
MTVPHYNRVGSILDLKNQRQRDATVGKILSYMLRLTFWKKNYGPPLCVLWTALICIFFFRNFNEKCPNLTESLPYNSGTTQNDFWIKETNKRAQNGDKKRTKTLLIEVDISLSPLLIWKLCLESKTPFCYRS